MWRPNAPILYDYRMTYIVGMRSSDGVVLGADGLVTRYYSKDPNKVRKVLLQKRKIHKITPYLLVGFSGNAIYKIDLLAKYLRQDMERFKPKSVHEAMQYIRATIGNFYLEPIDAGVQLEILVAGYNFNSSGQPSTPALYRWNPITRENRQYGCVPIGRTDEDLDEELDDKYSASSGETETLEKLAIRLVATSGKKYAEDVGGDTFIYRLTKSGVSGYKVPMLDPETKVKLHL